MQNLNSQQPNANDHQIRTVAMQFAAGRAEEGASMEEIIEDAKSIELFIKFGTTPATPKPDRKE